MRVRFLHRLPLISESSRIGLDSRIRIDMDKKILLGLYPGYTSVLGPYYRSDGRQHVVLNSSSVSKGTTGKTKTISYPKALKEIELNRRLDDGETIDHHDRDFTNNDLNNLKVKTLAAHASEDARRVTVEKVICPECLSTFVPSVNQRNKQRIGEQPAGPFCSKSCTGKYGAKVQNGGKVLKRTPIEKTYYYKEK